MKWGIKLGGSEIACSVITEAGHVVEQGSVPTESENGYDHVIGQIDKLIAIISGRVGARPDLLGIGTPGTVDSNTGVLNNCHTQSLNFKPLGNDLSKTLGVPVIVSNDANCFTLAECNHGIVAKEVPRAKTVYGVILGATIRASLVINCQTKTGRSFKGVELGHSVLEPDGESCYCGKNGCVETLISSTALQSFYMRKSGRRLAFADIYEQYLSGRDILADETIQRLIKYFGLTLSNVINTIDPDVIVLGGAISNVPILYDEGIKEVYRNVFNNNHRTPILKAMLGDCSGGYGAAYLGDFRAVG